MREERRPRKNCGMVEGRVAKERAAHARTVFFVFFRELLLYR